MNKYYVYILTNKSNRVLYTGVTNNIDRRIYEHKNSTKESFTKKYNVNKLVFIEEFNSIYEAIKSEKIIKGWIRVKKITLIESINPTWKDLLKD